MNTTSPERRLRFITAASLFDGHDAAINIMRRVLQSQGAEVIHLGHDRSVQDVVDAAIEEDVHGIAVSSYQGGHNEYFKYMVDQLAARGRADIRVFGGGGGTITDREIETLHASGVEHIYSVEDGRKLGLVGMIDDMLAKADRELAPDSLELPVGALERNPAAVARMLTIIEAAHGSGHGERLAPLQAALAEQTPAPIVGITGVGGAGKSSLTDELVRRYLDAFEDRTIAVLSVDPSRRRSGGALLGDRIRMNSVVGVRTYMRSMATRMANTSVPVAIKDALDALARVGYDLVILETAGIGQSGSEVVDVSDVSLYVMTPEYGAPTQLEKIDMLDFADVVAINKSDKRGADDARRYVAKQMQRNREAFDSSPDAMPVFSCTASRYGDIGVDGLFMHLMNRRRNGPDEIGVRASFPNVPQALRSSFHPNGSATFRRSARPFAIIGPTRKAKPERPQKRMVYIGHCLHLEQTSILPAPRPRGWFACDRRDLYSITRHLMNSALENEN